MHIVAIVVLHSSKSSTLLKVALPTIGEGGVISVMGGVVTEGIVVAVVDSRGRLFCETQLYTFKIGHVTYSYQVTKSCDLHSISQ